MSDKRNDKTEKPYAPYLQYIQKVLPTGSRVICSPPVLHTDEDYIILCKPEAWQGLEAELMSNNWEEGTSPGTVQNIQPLRADSSVHDNGTLDTKGVFHSWKKEIPGIDRPAAIIPLEMSDVEEAQWNDYWNSFTTVNFIVTCNEEYFNDFVRSTFLCKRLNLLKKPDRVTVFKALCENVWPGNEPEENKDIFRKMDF